MHSLKNSILYLSVVLILCTLSCTSENSQAIDSTHSALTFSTSFQQRNLVVTRVNSDENHWGKGDIGVLVLKSSEEEYPDANDLIHHNRKYTLSDAEVFVPASEEHSIHFPEKENAVDFIAYYPYHENLEHYFYLIDVQTQTNPHAIDLRYSNEQKRITSRPENNNVQLTFNHQLAKLVLNITSEDDTDLSDLVTEITGMYTQSSFSILDQTFTDDENSIQTITMNTTLSSNEKAVCEAIILPSTQVHGGHFSFKIPSIKKAYQWDIPSTQSYESNTKYLYNIMLKTNNSVALTSTVKINEWNEQTQNGIFAYEMDYSAPHEITDTQKGDYYFLETFGKETFSNPKKISNFTHWDMKAPILFSGDANAAYLNANSKSNMSIYFPASKHSNLKISNIPNSYSNVTLSYDLSASKTNTNPNTTMIQIKVNDVLISVPNQAITSTTTPQTVTVKLSTSPKTLEFISTETLNNTGLRLDNIKLTGNK